MGFPSTSNSGSTPFFASSSASLSNLMVMLFGLLPFVGGLLHFALLIAGIGACVLEWRRRRHAPPAAV